MSLILALTQITVPAIIGYFNFSAWSNPQGHGSKEHCLVAPGGTKPIVSANYTLYLQENPTVVDGTA